MFSDVFVCSRLGGLGLCPGGSLSGGVSVKGGFQVGGLCPGRDLCLGDLSGGVSVQGVSVQGGSLFGRVSVRETPIR